MKAIEYIKSDLYRYEGKSNFRVFIKNYFFNAGFKYSLYLRLAKKYASKRISKYTIYPFIWILLKRYTYRYGIEISYKTNIGFGFYIGHFSGIIVSKGAKIGNNCNISQGVTIGFSSRGKKRGYPIIGDNVYIAPGAKIFGQIVIGNNVAIGANCVVNKDIPENSVVVGNPCQIISMNGTNGLVNNVVVNKTYQ